MDWGRADLHSCRLTNCIVCEIRSAIMCWRSDAQKQLLGNEGVFAGRKVSRAAQLAILHEHCNATASRKSVPAANNSEEMKEG